MYLFDNYFLLVKVKTIELLINENNLWVINQKSNHSTSHDNSTESVVNTDSVLYANFFIFLQLLVNTTNVWYTILYIYIHTII